jgi:hypothetical protein
MGRKSIDAMLRSTASLITNCSVALYSRVVPQPIAVVSTSAADTTTTRVLQRQRP